MLSDYGFKATFGNESDMTFLKQAIPALIDSDIPLRKLRFDTSEVKAYTKESRGGISDIACTDKKGNNYIVEMQMTNVKNFIKRGHFYALQKYGTMVKKGDFKFEGLRKIYIISILNGIAYPKIDDYYHIGHVRNQKGELLYDGITHVVIELGKWKKQVKDIHSDLDKLIYVMKTTHQLTVTERFTPPPFWNEKWLKSAIKELDLANMSPEERAYAERQIIKAMHELTYQKEKEAAERKAKRVDIAEQKAEQAEQEKEQAEQEKERAEQEREQAEQEREQARQSLNLAIKGLLTSGMIPEKVAQMLPQVNLQQIINIQQELDKNEE